MPSITLAIHTVSRDNFLQEHGIPSYITALVKTLEKQTFKDFELVYVDYYKEQNKELVESLNPPFTIKHVTVHPNHRYWYNQGIIHISAAKNTELLYADGELYITCDDAEFFNPDFLQTYWTYYKDKGRYHSAYHYHYETIEVENGLPLLPIRGKLKEGKGHQDTRKFYSDVHLHNLGQWTYAGTSCNLEHALRVNGFNERMDGYKGQEDCDFGMRVAATGGKYVIDKRSPIAILNHHSYMDDAEKPFKDFIALEYYGVIKWGEELGISIANKGDINQRQLDVVQRETLKYRKFDPLAEANKQKLDIWKATPTFDLIEERVTLRKSDLWLW